MNFDRAVLMLMMAAQSGPVEFTSGASSSAAGASPATVTKPAGLEVGDLVLVVCDTDTGATLTTTSGPAWSGSYVANGTLAYGGVKLFWKVMTATDVANAWTLSFGGNGARSARYRGNGANAVTVKSTGSGSSGSTLTLAGFAKSASTYGVITVMINTADPAVPAGFTSRYNAVVGAERIHFADNQAAYVDGASVTWTPVFPGDGYVGFLLEVTGE
jgi:hypothetical protein